MTDLELNRKLFQHFEKYIKLSETLKKELSNRVEPKTFKKGELVHHADTVCTKKLFYTERTFKNILYKGWKRNYRIF